MERVIGLSFQAPHLSSRLAFTANSERRIGGQDVRFLTFTYVIHSVEYLIFVKFRCLTCELVCKLNSVYFASATLMFGCMIPATLMWITCYVSILCKPWLIRVLRDS